jgi:hypothetical protein
MKFYPSDWRSDQALRVCSLAARGLWIEMLCVMHTATPYGHLLINGSPVSDTQLAMLAGIPPEQVSALVGELEAAGVFSCTGKGVIYSRRMTRDEKKAVLARKNGKAGGNPNLCKTKPNPPPDNPPDKPHVNGEDKAQRPEARSQKEEGGGGSAGAGAREVAARVAGITKLPETVRNLATVEAWLTAGYDPERDIYPAVAAVMGAAKEPIGSFKYFTQPIGRHFADRITPKQESTNVHPIRNAGSGRKQSGGSLISRIALGLA